MIEEFIKTCREIGENTNLVQAGGGNISLKTNSSEMLVKSTGVELSNVSEKQGIVNTDFRKIKAFVESASEKECSEKEYMEALKQSIIENSIQMPSMETGFHSILGNAVIHTHPISINSIVCAKNGKTLVKEALNENFVWVPYETPGIDLSMAILKQLQQSDTSGKSTVVFLENHGLIVSSETLDEAAKKTLEINSKIIEYLKTRKKADVFLESELSVDEKQNEFFIKEFESLKLEKLEGLFDGFPFPDAVVYYENGFSLEKNSENTIIITKPGTLLINKENNSQRRKILEVCLAHICVLLNVNQFGKPVLLKQEKVSELMQMESEKLRKKVE